MLQHYSLCENVVPIHVNLKHLSTKVISVNIKLISTTEEGRGYQNWQLMCGISNYKFNIKTLNYIFQFQVYYFFFSETGARGFYASRQALCTFNVRQRWLRLGGRAIAP